MADSASGARESARRKPARRATPALKPRSGAGAPDLDPVIHERLRLSILSALAVNDVLSFSELKAHLGTSDGNVSVHARRLEEAGYISCTKRFEKRVPRTEYRITAKGGAALRRYLDHMEALIRATRRG